MTFSWSSGSRGGPRYLQLVDLLHDEVLAVLCLPPCLLLDGPCIWSHGQVMLDDMAWYAGEIRRIPREDVIVLSEENYESPLPPEGEAVPDGHGMLSTVTKGDLLRELRFLLEFTLPRPYPRSGPKIRAPWRGRVGWRRPPASPGELRVWG